MTMLTACFVVAGSLLLAQHELAIECDWDESGLDAQLWGAEQIRFAYPLVRLYDGVNDRRHDFSVTSADYPPAWNKVFCNNLEIQVEIPLPDALALERVEVSLDHQPLDLRHSRTTNRELIGDASLPWIESYVISCQSPGKHIIQARYKVQGIWSSWSPALRFEVLRLRRPEITAVIDEDGLEQRTGKREKIANVNGDELTLRLGNVSPADDVVVTLAGKKIANCEVDSICQIKVRIDNQVPPGVYPISVYCTAKSNCPCGYPSEPSEEVLIHYFNLSVYQLRTPAVLRSASTSSDPETAPLFPTDVRRKSIFFASAANFSLHEFGPQGTAIDREGIVIGEDMEFRFDDHGNYELFFHANSTNTPVTLRLQFVIESYRGGPWYTVTLEPIAVEASRTSAPPQTLDFHRAGHSEILKRYFTSIEKINRTGTARFGFGAKAMSQALKSY
jgi:hypothetical protein